MPSVEIPQPVLESPLGTLTAVAFSNDTVLFVREDDWGLKKYPLRDCPVDLRMGTWDMDGVLLVALVVRFARNDVTTADCCLNVAHAPAVRVLQCLAAQTQIDIHLVIENVARSFRIANPLRMDAGFLVNDIRTIVGWPPEQFNRAATRLNKLFPTPPALWRACEQQSLC